MKKFRVWAKCSNYCYLDVEANSAEEAEEIAGNTDGGDFITDDNPYSGDWEIIDNTEEIA